MRSRIRSVVVGWVVGATFAAVALGAVGAGAANDDPVKYGNSNTESLATVFCLAATNVCGGSGSVALIGQSEGSGRYGVKGVGSAAGVWAFGNDVTAGYGLYAQSSATRGIGVYSTADTAVDAEGATEGVIAKGHVAMFARGEIDGVVASVSQFRGIAVTATNDKGGVALEVNGKARFDRSGVARIGAGKRSATVNLARVSPRSMVLATAQQSAGAFVRAAVPGKGSFVIQLSGPAPAGGLRVAWFVLN